MGEFNDLAIDAQDGLHTAYYDTTNRDPRYAWLDGTNWRGASLQTTATAGTWISIGVTPGGSPFAAYYDFTSGVWDTKLAMLNAAGSFVVEVASTGDGYAGDGGTAVAVDSTGAPHVAYRDGLPGRLVIH